jgi:lipopolysaccharide export system protein LptA
MLQQGTYDSKPRKIVLIGNYLPRQGGIATFTADLLTGRTDRGKPCG